MLGHLSAKRDKAKLLRNNLLAAEQRLQCQVKGIDARNLPLMSPEQERDRNRAQKGLFLLA